jgi:hypothetical protein
MVLGRFKGLSGQHTESDLRIFTTSQPGEEDQHGVATAP